MPSPHTRQKLVQDLGNLGVGSGDMLFVHSSFKSLGSVEGGAETVIGALEEVLGPYGLLLMPSFNMVEPERRAPTWNISTTTSNVGWLTEFFRRMPGTSRSDHYSHSVAARGKEAGALVADHLSREGYVSPWDLEPWGHTYGLRSPMYRAWQAGAKILMLGVDYESSTYIHLVEVIHWNRHLQCDPAAYPSTDRVALGAYWERAGCLQRGDVGDAECRLFPVQDFVSLLLKEVERDLESYLI